MPPCAFDCRPPALDFLNTDCLDNYFVTLVVYGTNLFACNGKLFYKPPNYYPETLYPLVTASIGGVKTIRTLRSDAPFKVSDMKSSYLARRGNLATGERLLRACLDGLRQTQYGLLYTPFLSGLAEVLAPAGRPDDSLAAADEALRRTERRDGFCWMPEALRVKGEAPLLSDKADTTAAEDHFRRSLDLARRQKARLL